MCVQLSKLRSVVLTYNIFSIVKRSLINHNCYWSTFAFTKIKLTWLETFTSVHFERMSLPFSSEVRAQNPKSSPLSKTSFWTSQFTLSVAWLSEKVINASFISNRNVCALYMNPSDVLNYKQNCPKQGDTPIVYVKLSTRWTFLKEALALIPGIVCMAINVFFIPCRSWTIYWVGWIRFLKCQ